MLLGGEGHSLHCSGSESYCTKTSFLCRRLSTEQLPNGGHVSVTHGLERGLCRVWFQQSGSLWALGRSAGTVTEWMGELRPGRLTPRAAVAIYAQGTYLLNLSHQHGDWGPGWLLPPGCPPQL